MNIRPTLEKIASDLESKKKEKMETQYKCVSCENMTKIEEEFEYCYICDKYACKPCAAYCEKCDTIVCENCCKNDHCIFCQPDSDEEE